MARKARQTSGTGIYHVMLRGINRQAQSSCPLVHAAAGLGDYYFFFVYIKKVGGCFEI